MTTIAWDGTTLAGDTFVTRQGNLHRVPSKVFKTKRGLLGIAGTESQALSLRRWLDDPNKVPTGPMDDVAGLWIRPDGHVYYLHNSLIWVPYLPRTHDGKKIAAIGSGGDFALCGMILKGMTAMEAVHFACTFDSGSMDPLTAVEMNPWDSFDKWDDLL